MSGSVLFLERSWWLYVSPDISLNRLIEIEHTLQPVLRDRLIDMVRARLGMDEDAA